MGNYARELFGKKCKYSIRKLTVGVCSVMIGAILLGSSPVLADEASETIGKESNSHIVLESVEPNIVEEGES